MSPEFRCQLRQVEPQQLIGGALVAGRERASDEVSAVANHVAAETVPAMWHRRQTCPAVRLGIEGFVFGKGMIGWQFAAQHQDQAAIIGGGEAAARRRQRRPGQVSVAGSYTSCRPVRSAEPLKRPPTT